MTVFLKSLKNLATNVLQKFFLTKNTIEMLDKKLDEELAEYHNDKNIEELADLLEVIYACTQARGYSLEDLEKVRAEKAEQRGGFSQKILLKETVVEDE